MRILEPTFQTLNQRIYLDQYPGYRNSRASFSIALVSVRMVEIQREYLVESSGIVSYYMIITLLKARSSICCFLCLTILPNSLIKT